MYVIGQTGHDIYNAMMLQDDENSSSIANLKEMSLSNATVSTQELKESLREWINMSHNLS